MGDNKRRLSCNAEESEKALESYLCRLVREAGGLALKYASGTATGFPDRLLLFPRGRVIWVEVKSKGCSPTALQSHRMAQLRELGLVVRLCDSRAKAEEIVRLGTVAVRPNRGEYFPKDDGFNGFDVV